MREYRRFLAQAPRIEAFRRAITQVVGSDDRVLDVGTGLGTFGFFAADAGAKRVWSVDGGPILNVAKAIAKANGYDGAVEFIRGWIPEVALPERATVLIFEDFSPRFFDDETFRLLRELHRRYLEPGARTIPRRARFQIAPVSSDGLWRIVAPLGAEDDHAYGIDWAASREYLVNTPLPVWMTDDAVAARPASVGEFRLDAPADDARLDWSASWTLDDATTVHGLAFWYDLELIADEWLSNAPGEEPATWGQLFLPADQPLAVPAGGELKATVWVERLPDGAPGWLGWTLEAGGIVTRGHEFAASPASLADLYVRCSGPVSTTAPPRLERAAAVRGAEPATLETFS